MKRIKNYIHLNPCRLGLRNYYSQQKVSHLKFESFSEEDSDEVVHFISNMFHKEEPLTIAANSLEDVTFFVRVVCERAVKEKTSFVCKDEGRIIGALINEDYIQPPQDLGEGQREINLFIEELNTEFERKCNPQKGEYLHFFLGCVEPSYRKNGVFNILIEKSIEAAKKKNFVGGIAEPTNTKSMNAFKKFGFEILKEMEYTKWRLDGKQVFSHKIFEMHPKCYSMYKIF